MAEAIFERVLTPEGWRRDVLVAWQAGRITEIVPEVAAPRAAGVERIAGALVPGVGNLHSHAFQRGFAGLTERRGEGAADHFWTWREAMYRFAGAVTPEDLEAIAAMAQVEMLESGFTGVAEFHYVHHRPDGGAYDDPAEMSAAIVRAAETTGIGLTLLPVFYAHGGFQDRPTGPGQRRFVCDLDRFARLHESAARAVSRLDGGRIGIAPHSLRAANPEELRALAALHRGGPIHIHIAEQTAEVEDCLAATGARPVDRLYDVVEVDAHWCLVHATHVTAGEVARMAASGAVVGLCPITEADLGDGIFPAVDFRAQGGVYGVGSDSNVLISLPQELRLLEQSQRLRDRARNRMAEPPLSTGRALFEAAALGGARALGAHGGQTALGAHGGQTALGAHGGQTALGLDAGRIATGATADFVVLDCDHDALVGRGGDATLDAWIFAAATNPVRDVWRAGRRVVADGRHVARDEVVAAWRRALLRLAMA